MKFSKRQMQVFKMIAMGMSNKEMARELDIDVKTIETHKDRLWRRLGTNRTALVTIAYYRIVFGVEFPVTENFDIEHNGNDSPKCCEPSARQESNASLSAVSP